VFPGFRMDRLLLGVGGGRRWGWFLGGLFSLAILGGCSRLRPLPATQYVYVTAKQTFLRDRVAAVAERTGTVENGQRLEVLEHGRRFYRVKTEKGEQGWIDEKAVATQEVYDGFQALRDTRKGDPAVASAVVRDEVNLHLKPGRDTEKFYRLGEGDKLQLLDRATLPKPVPAAMAPAKLKAGEKIPPIAMEDWWLVRDGQGRAGWLLSRMMDVDAPESLTRYAEGQRFVGAYVLTTVHDEGVDGDNKDIPIYLTVLGPYTAGLPYDFDQVRVFTWSLKMHRYETAFRDKNIEGYLPVSIKTEKDPYGKSVLAQTPLPTFTYKVLAADAGEVAPDPATGMVTPGRTIAKTYRLEGTLVRRVAPPGTKDEPEAHPAVEEKKAKKK
jgi:SH3-like domain-containing protein